MRRVLPIAVFALAPLLPACASVNDLKRGDLTVPPAIILESGESADVELDVPLNAILDARVAGGLTAMDEERTVAAIRAQAMRNSSSAVPRLEQLVFDASDEVRIQSLAALEQMNSVSSLPVIAELATTISREDVNETAYQVFSKLSGTQVNYLDRKKLEQVLADRGMSKTR